MFNSLAISLRMLFCDNLIPDTLPQLLDVIGESVKDKSVSHPVAVEVVDVTPAYFTFPINKKCASRCDRHVILVKIVKCPYILPPRLGFGIGRQA